MKRKVIVGVALLALALMATGCSNGGTQTSSTGTSAATAAAQGTVQKIDAQTAHDQMAASSDFILLDVRTPAEYAEEHIDGAINLSSTDIQAKAAEVLPDKNAVIYVYCRSGSRSSASSALLAQMGYMNVYDMGGIIDWPYGTVSGN